MNSSKNKLNRLEQKTGKENILTTRAIECMLGLLDRARKDDKEEGKSIKF
jgi:ribosome-binding protein aMBF1 (putative translation factor)